MYVINKIYSMKKPYTCISCGYEVSNKPDKGMLIVKSKLICDAIIGVTNFSL